MIKKEVSAKTIVGFTFMLFFIHQMNAPVFPAYMVEHGLSASLNGIAFAIYSLGAVLASIIGIKVINNIGVKKSIVMMTLMLFILNVMFIFVYNPIVYGLLKFAVGFTLATITLSISMFLSNISCETNVRRNMANNIIAISAGAASGMFVSGLIAEHTTTMNVFLIQFILGMLFVGSVIIIHVIKSIKNNEDILTFAKKATDNIKTPKSKKVVDVNETRNITVRKMKIMVFCCQFTSVVISANIAFYLFNEFGFSSAAVSMYLSLTCLIILIVNKTLAETLKKLAYKKYLRIQVILGLTGISISLIALFLNMPLLIVLGLFTMNAGNEPIKGTVMEGTARICGQKDNVTIAKVRMYMPIGGFIAGTLSGVLYLVNPNSIFLLSFVSLVVMLIMALKTNKKANI